MEEKSIVRLAHWAPQFYGNVSITDKWRQNKSFKDTVRDIDTVIGDIEKAMQGTYAENSKLDLYMKLRAVRFPVSYLRMYQKHGNIETLLTCGAGKMLAMLMEQEKKENIQSYRELYGNRIPKIEEIDWKAKRPSHMLRMTRGELRTELRDKKLNANGLRNFLAARKGGAPVDITEDAGTLNGLNERTARRIVAHGQNPRRAETYIKCQKRRFPGENVELTELADYWDMLKEKSRETMYPAHLRRAHDQLVMQQEFRENKELCGKFARRYQELKKYCFAADGLEVFPPIKESDLIREGKVLEHCVASYAKRHAEGETVILFIRRENDREMPFYTLNLDKDGKKVIQNHGKRNQKQTPEVQAFEDRFMAWVRGGCRRDKDGKPIEEKERKTA